jgi:hypothetical protein
MGAEITPEVAAEVRERLESVRDGLSDVREELHRLAERAAARKAKYGEGPSDEMRERLAQFTDTDVVYLAFEMRNAAIGQAGEGHIPAAGVFETLTAALAEMTVRFVPPAVIERVDRIMDDEAKPDFAEGRFLRELEGDDA